MKNMNEYLEKHKEKLEKTGRFKKERIEKILENLKQNYIKKEEERKEYEEKLKDLVNKMLKKEEMEDGAYYLGHRFRGDAIAKWDKKLNRFICINWTMGDFFAEKLEHFQDVWNTRLDGFAPMKKIEIEKFF